MNMKRLGVVGFFALVGSICLGANPEWAASQSDKKIKVFILAGQSNMEGRGFPKPLSWQVSQPKYRERYTHFIKDGDHDAFTRSLQDSLQKDPKAPVYSWSTRGDVWINYFDKRGDD